MNQLTNPEAEQAVVGALIRRPSEDTINALKAADFSNAVLGAAFAEIAAAYRRGETISVVALADRVGQQSTFFRELADAAPLDASAEARLVADYSIRRAVWAVGEQAQRLAANGTDISVVQAVLQDVVDEARRQASTGDTLMSVWDAQRQLLAEINAESSKPFAARKLPLLTGWSGWDKILDGGMIRGDKIMIGGAPGTMKSTIIQQIANFNAAPGVGRGSMLVAAEMLPEQYAARGMSAVTSVSARRIMSRWVNSDQLAALNKTPPEPDLVLISHTKDINQITADFWRAKARLEQAGSDLGLLAIDYIQSVSWPGQRWSSRKEEVDAILDRLDMLSDYCPVVVVSSINREGNIYERPTIRQAAATYKMEYQASLFFLLWSDSMGIRHWHVGKVRDGGQGPEGIIYTDGPRITSMS